MTKFCVRKDQKNEGRVYAMDYDGPSDDSDNEETNIVANIMKEKRQEDSWSSDPQDTDEEDSDNDHVNKLAETFNNESDSEDTSEEEDMEHIKVTIRNNTREQ